MNTREQTLTTLFGYFSDVIVRLDRNSRYLSVNAAFEAATGIPVSKALEKTYQELGLEGDAYAFWEKRCQDAFQSGQEQCAEFDLPTPEGIRWYHARIIPEFNENGDVETVLSIARDISDRKRAEEELRIYQKYLKHLTEQRTKEIAQRNTELQREIEERKRIEEHLRFTEFSVERSSIATVWLEADGAIFRINTAACRLLGYPAQELLTMTIYDFEMDLPHGITREGWDEFWRRLIEQQHFDREFQYKRQDGGLCVLEMSNNYFEYESESYCLAFLRDITERKQAEAELQQAKEAAEAANQAKSVFLANMSHEFRTPLNAILGYTQLLKRNRGLTEELRKMIETIHASGEHLLLIINDVLDLSKIEARKIELRPHELHLPSFLKNIIEMFRIRAQQQGILFTYAPGENLPENVLADEKYLRQILLNLLGNAIKFTPEGNVTLRVRRLLNTIPSVSTIRFEVKDSGIGIPADQLEKIFLPFHQGQERLSYTEGTGLGLAISQRLVRLMNGELHVESTVGQGSVFWFSIELPEIHNGHFQRQPERHEKIISCKGPPPLVLVADDKMENRMLLKDLLLSLGFEVLEARNGREAFDKARLYTPDIILMDLVMPIMTGQEAATRIRQTAGLEAVPIIAVSAGVFAQTREESLDAGCDGFLSKPVNLDKLLHTLQTHLKLEWIFRTEEEMGDSIEPPEPLPIVPPPHETLAELLNLAMMGDVLSLQEQANILKMQTPELAPFSEKLERLANEFLVDELQTFLTSYASADSKADPAEDA